jgi:hypothetical protein
LDTDDVELSEDISASHPKSHACDPHVPHQKSNLSGVFGNQAEPAPDGGESPVREI